MAKSTSKKQQPTSGAEDGKQTTAQQAPAEKLAMKKARSAFAKQARARGEVTTDGEAPLHSSALFTESATGELTRHRFSLVPESLLPPDGPDH
jgi:hypothetical protein